MRCRHLVFAVLLGACGRIGFTDVPLSMDTAPPGDSSPAVGDGAIGSCLEDDFNDNNVDDWIVVTPEIWGPVESDGRDGSTSFRALGGGNMVVTHPALRNVISADISVEFRIDDGSFGDFKVYFLVPGWADITDSNYRAGMYPNGSDDPADAISRNVGGVGFTTLASRPTTTQVSTWHRLEMALRLDRSIGVKLDGADYLESAPDQALSPPFDIAFHFYESGALDNVRVDCTR